MKNIGIVHELSWICIHGVRLMICQIISVCHVFIRKYLVNQIYIQCYYIIIKCIYLHATLLKAEINSEKNTMNYLYIPN
jgi:hypothetical protein